MRVYPDERRMWRQTVAGDALLVLGLAVLAWVAITVHNDIAGLAQLGDAVARTGTSVQRGFGDAAGAVGGIPVVGGSLAQGLRHAGASTGGTVVSTGQTGASDVRTAAVLVALLVFLAPAALMTGRYVPARLHQVRRMTAAARVLDGSEDPERVHLIAQRAAFALPYEQLLHHSRDPLGDLLAGHYEPLIAALMEDAGVRPRPTRARR